MRQADVDFTVRTDLALEERGLGAGVRFRGSGCRSGKKKERLGSGDGGRGV